MGNKKVVEVAFAEISTHRMILLNTNALVIEKLQTTKILSNEFYYTLSGSVDNINRERSTC